MAVFFRKMHGAGNDFVVLDARVSGAPTSAARAAGLADRATGIGCDQVITLLPASPGSRASVRMLIQNPDGTEAGACGNASRCVTDLLAGETGHSSFAIQTIAGILQGESLCPGEARVAMGVPGLAWQDIPLAHAADTLHLPLPGDPAAASMGNPHATYFVADVGAEDVLRRAPGIQANPLFLAGVNVGFAQILAPDRMRLRVFERGAGLTRACGSGACAALVNARRRGLCGASASVEMDGGTLKIYWREDDGQVLMAGPAVTSFSGTFDPANFPP